MKTRVKNHKSRHASGEVENTYFPEHTVAGVWFNFQIKKNSPKGPYYVDVVFDSKKEAKEFLSQFKNFEDVKAWEKSTWEVA